MWAWWGQRFAGPGLPSVDSGTETISGPHKNWSNLILTAPLNEPLVYLC